MPDPSKRTDAEFQRLFDEALRDDDPTTALGLALENAGARMTFDAERSIAKPCVRCGTTSAPRDLVAVATWIRNGIGGHAAGDAMTRPLCATCEEETMSNSKLHDVEDLTTVPDEERTRVIDVVLCPHVRDTLQAEADKRCMTLEDYVRGLVLTAAAVDEVGGSSSTRRGTT